MIYLYWLAVFIPCYAFGHWMAYDVGESKNHLKAAAWTLGVMFGLWLFCYGLVKIVYYYEQADHTTTTQIEK